MNKGKNQQKSEVASDLPANAGYGASDPKGDDLAKNTEDSAGEFLTTNQGVRINDNQNSLKAGDRGPTLLEDFILREKITHFDHERIPERVVHATRVCRPRLFSSLRIDGRIHEGRVSSGPVGQDTGVCSLLDRCRLAWLNRSCARRARFRRKVLHAGRELRSGR